MGPVRLRLIVIALAVAALAAAGWFPLPWVQEKRADARLSDANAHIEAANQYISQVQPAALAPSAFSSQDNINQARDAVAAALPLVTQAQQESTSAANDAGAAANYWRLPSWYSDYLSRKQQAADLRTTQAQTLTKTLGQLQLLYANGATVFQADQDLDRLLGQFQVADAKVQSDPASARTELDQVAASLRSVQQRLQDAYNSNGFELLSWLAQAAGSHADLAELSSQLADAAAAGDQGRAQTVAQQIQAKLGEIAGNSHDLDYWLQTTITPLRNDFENQRRQEEQLDAEAAAIYAQHRGSPQSDPTDAQSRSGVP